MWIVGCLFLGGGVFCVCFCVAFVVLLLFVCLFSMGGVVLER